MSARVAATPRWWSRRRALAGSGYHARCGVAVSGSGHDPQYGDGAECAKSVGDSGRGGSGGDCGTGGGGYPAVAAAEPVGTAAASAVGGAAGSAPAGAAPDLGVA